jgi:hypothetical protein
MTPEQSIIARCNECGFEKCHKCGREKPRGGSSNLTWILVTILLLFVLAAAATERRTQAQRTTATAATKARWEYKAILPSKTTTDDMNRLGDEGWELVDVQGDSPLASVFWFKRAK